MARTPWLALLAYVAGCRQLFGLHELSSDAHDQDTPSGDIATNGDVGSSVDGSFPGTCFGAGTFTVCLDTLPTNTVVLNVGTYNTDSDLHCAATQPVSWKFYHQPDACFVIGRDVVVTPSGGPAIFTGSRPLVLLGTHSVAIAGELFVASRRRGTPGPGANASACLPGTLPKSGGGGGAGGSFMTVGGDGGGAGGLSNWGHAAPTVTAPSILRGGCPGQRGDNNGAASTGDPGAGGGAVYLVSGNMISINRINASGAGGLGGGVNAGAGGGGSGGMIVLYAPQISASSATVIAEGGGGAGGGSGGGAPGGDGGDPTGAGAWGVGGMAGTTETGGDGFHETNVAAGPGGSIVAGGGGGGGGGGAGYIMANLALAGVLISPPATTM